MAYNTYMNITYKSNNNVVYSCKYHVVWCPKYRRKILTNGIDAELMHGVEKSKAVEKNRLALTLLLANIEILDFDSLAAESYGKIRADLEKAGTPIGPLDMMIAGHAQSLGYTVVTNNTKEFDRVKSLKVENWAN